MNTKQRGLFDSFSRSIMQRLIATCKTQRDEIGDSDLDNEQPITLNVHLTLGDIRMARRLVNL